MTILGLDIGSSSVKAGIVRGGRIIGAIARASFPTRFCGPRAEVNPDAILQAIAAAVAELPAAGRIADCLGLSVMSPAWIAMDRLGKPLTPVVTHQDRRSVELARELDRRMGGKFLAIAGNRPFPGGISATTLAWFAAHAPGIIRRANLVGHLNTFLHAQITAQRVIDPSNASFTGLYETVKQGGWSEELCQAVGISTAKLPVIFPANGCPGKVTAAAARRLGLVQGMPMMAGIIDTSAAMLLAGARDGQLLNVCGSSDVLALCTDRPYPCEKLLTRALGVGRRWMSVATLAAGGATLDWAKGQLFADLTTDAFFALLAGLARQTKPLATGGVVFEPYLAGERTSIEQKSAAFTGLTLATTRQEMLAAIINALAQASAERLNLLRFPGVKIRRRVVISGGAARGLHRLLHRDWPGRWTFHAEDEASLRGLSRLLPGRTF